MRHISHNRLLRDHNDDVIGFLPQAFELRDNEKGLSVNWIEFFGDSKESSRSKTMQKFRDTRKVGKGSGYGIAIVGDIEKVCTAHGHNKVKVLLDPIDENESHSIIIRLPRDDLALNESLAVNAFTECILEKDVL